MADWEGGYKTLERELEMARERCSHAEAENDQLRAELADAKAKADALDALQKWLVDNYDTKADLSYDIQCEVELWTAALDRHFATAPTFVAAITSALSQARGAAGAGEPG